MAGTLAKARRRAETMKRLHSALGLDLSGLNAKGDRELLHIMHLERIADAVEEAGVGQDIDLQAAVDRADRDTLKSLVGVGDVTADRMMEGREGRLAGEDG